MVQLTATEIIELMNEIELVEATILYSNNTEDCINRIFYKAFGEWDRVKVLKDFRKNINSLMELKESQYNKGYYYLVDKDI